MWQNQLSKQAVGFDCTCAKSTCTLAVLEMAESEFTSGVLKDLQINSYVRGYHAYVDLWTPALNEELILKREPTNETDRNAVAILKEETVVGHVPFNLAPLISAFLRRDTNCGFAKVVGEKVNRGAGYGLEIPCVYALYGPEPYILKLEELLTSLEAKGLV